MNRNTIYDHDKVLRLFGQGLTAKEIACKVGCPLHSAYNIVYSKGLDFGRKQYTQEQVDEVVNLYATGLAAREVAKLTGCSPAVVYLWVRESGQEVRVKSDPPGQKHEASPETRAVAVDRYLAGEDALEIGLSLGYTAGTVRNWVRATGKTLRPAPGTFTSAQKAEAVELYRSGYSITDLGREYGCDPSACYRWLKKAGLRTGTRKAKTKTKTKTMEKA
jgi:transposase-like protein